MNSIFLTLFPFVFAALLVGVAIHWGILIRLFLLKYKKKKIPHWLRTYQGVMRIGK